ncbi:uncharacterized protein BXZ73DRAFT_107869 [Epithele typhae]|uniref:uncharacterized protein n=1 Tax=Epithele typhae TaxID=378194 RepID=UPI002007E176|nr:uncharacterized protein BXZ73DRAFT_107869 [Epithele typhae]KAH9911683.1 hypothetical protein BXZ73DRAFT_107869 [Epithele typhae]
MEQISTSYTPSSLHRGYAERCISPFALNDPQDASTVVAKEEHLFLRRTLNAYTLHALGRASPFDFSSNPSSSRSSPFFPDSDGTASDLDPASRPASPFDLPSVSAPPSLLSKYARHPVRFPTTASKAAPPPMSAGAGERIALPFPFPAAQLGQRVAFQPPQCAPRRAVSLAQWDRLAARRRSHGALRGAHDPLDAGGAFEGAERVLLQSHWPGYATWTHMLAMPAHVRAGARAFTRADLFDMVCGAMVDWVVRTSNAKHVVCEEPAWTVGPNEISLEHIYVVGAVEVVGYVSKWVPLLEVDERAFLCAW